MHKWGQQATAGAGCCRRLSLRRSFMCFCCIDLFICAIAVVNPFGRREGKIVPITDACPIDYSFAIHPVPAACKQRTQTRSDRTPHIVCPQDLAIALLTSANTASKRLPASLDTWVAFAEGIGVNVVVYSASALPKFPRTVVLDGVPTVASNAGRELSMYGIQDLHQRFPDAKWFLKFDDDAFLFPTNLMSELSQKIWKHTTSRRDMKSRMARNGLIGPDWRQAHLMGRIHGDGWTISGGAGLVFSQKALQEITRVDGIERCLNGSVFPDVKTFENGHGYNEDTLWNRCLTTLTNTSVLHVPSMHMHAPGVEYVSWGAHDGMSHFPSTFHWIKSSQKRKLQHCGQISQVHVIDW